MSKPRPRKRKPGELSPAGVNHNTFLDEQLDAARHQRDNIRPSWTVDPDDKDGFKVHIGCKGRVVLSQEPPFSEAVQIVLHPEEARRLLGILPEAIEAAEFEREGGVSLE